MHRLELRGGLFPFQTVALEPRAAVAAHRSLAERGVATVLHADDQAVARISLLVRATHTPAEIDAAVDALAEAKR